jgi:hypothetical protein
MHNQKEQKSHLPKYFLQTFVNNITSPKQTKTATSISGQYFSALLSNLLLCLVKDGLGTCSVVGVEGISSDFDLGD